MKTIHSRILSALTILSITALLNGANAQTASTVPVGFMTVTIPASPDGIIASSAAMSVPLYKAADFTGAVSTVDSSTQFTATGASWVAGAFANAAAPRLVRIKAGAQVGKIFPVTANTTNQLTIAGDLTGVLSIGDSIEVLPANTLGLLFGSTTPVLQTGATATTPGADNVFILTNNTWGTYYHNGVNWKKSGSLANQNNTIIYPDDGVFVVHYGTSPVALTFVGTVPSTSEQTDLVGSGSTFIANRFPVDTQLLATGIHLIPGWVNGATVDVADNVFAWNAAQNKWDTFYHNGVNWKKSGSLANQNTTVIPSGSAVVIKRSSATPATLTQALPYSVQP